MATRFRGDIQGIRAIAVLAVLLYHAGVPWFTGGYVGVDVFFVVSGFLITGLLIREMDATGTISLRSFYARRARRLLPASAATILGVGILTFVFLPVSRWASVAGDMIASTFYFMNWRLAGSSVDYLAVDQAPSPLQHFWSLAVEEQFYLIWPLILILFTIWHRRRGLSTLWPLTLGLLVVGVPSFVWSVLYTAEAPGPAYLVTSTRLWELALGGGLAIVVTSWQPKRLASEVLAIAGLLGILWAAVVYSAATAFPGWLAAIPTVGTAMLIAAGAGVALPLASRAIAVKPMEVVGDLSYSLYLWHWPIIIVLLTFADPLPIWLGLAGVVLSVIPAWLTKRAIEDPVRLSSWFKPLGRSAYIGIASALIGLAGAWALFAAPAQTATFVADPGDILGVVKTDSGATHESAPHHEVSVVIRPDPIDAVLDRPPGYYPECQQNQDSAELVRCDFGDPDGQFIVAVTGDSHAAQWVEALHRVSLARGWKLVTYTKSACPHLDVTVFRENGAPYVACDEWNAALQTELMTRLRPDLVLTSNSQEYAVMTPEGRLGPHDGRSYVADGLQRTWLELVDSGLAVIPIMDTPRPGINVPECVLEATDYMDECSIPTAAAMAGNTSQLAAARAMGLTLVDMTDRICTPDVCRPVESAILVWRDSNHLTNTYAVRIHRDLGERIDAALDGVIHGRS